MKNLIFDEIEKYRSIMRDDGTVKPTEYEIYFRRKDEVPEVEDPDEGQPFYSIFVQPKELLNLNKVKELILDESNHIFTATDKEWKEIAQGLLNKMHFKLREARDEK